MSPIFAYVNHQSGVADDSAFELLAAAKRIQPAATPIALVTGWGSALDAVCESLCNSYSEVWKIAAEPLEHPNAELVRRPWSPFCRRAPWSWLPIPTSASISRPAFPSS